MNPRPRFSSSSRVSSLPRAARRSVPPHAAASDLVEVALPLPAHQTFTYRVPEELPAPALGSRVLVPFGRRVRIGWVVGQGKPVASGKLKAVISTLDVAPSVTGEILEFARWVGRYYFAPLGLVLRAALPALLSDVSRDYVHVVDARAPAGSSEIDARVLSALVQSAGPRQVQDLARELGQRTIWPSIRRLVEQRRVQHDVVPPHQAKPRKIRVVSVSRWIGTLEERDRLFTRAKRQREALEWLESAGGTADLAAVLDQGFSRAVVKGLVSKDLVRVTEEERVRDPFSTVPEDRQRLTPTYDQKTVLDALLPLLDQKAPGPVLLRGVTGSGKTLVYMELLEAVLARGQGAIVLVPEIALTPQAVSRFRGRFGNQVAVLHSGLSKGERYDAWRELRTGARRIAVGARSAIFAPVVKLGAIVVDEEHDGSYKQSESPRYHARDLAVVRARAAGAVCLLGSATPSLESWRNAQTGKYALQTLPERATGVPLPPVRVLDLRAAKDDTQEDRDAESRGEGGLVLSRPLVAAVRARLVREEQSILLLNRRGYSSFIQCLDCGDVKPCPHCAVSLTYHRRAGRLLCHHCGHEEPRPVRCDRCGSDGLSFRGIGTEQVEGAVAETFPSARIARMDVDTTSGKWAHQRILERVGRGEVDILLGTQMIAKGLDFPKVTLVGVIHADVGLHLPDFRASERTFQLLSQVAGRAGRSAAGGEVLIQTRMPEHFAIRSAAAHDYEGFARRELADRKTPEYPPHVRLVNVVVSSPDEAAAAAGAESTVRWLKPRLPGTGIRLTGPAPAPIERLHGRWRWHFLLRSSRPQALETLGWKLQTEFALSGDTRLVLDRDAVALL